MSNISNTSPFPVISISSQTGIHYSIVYSLKIGTVIKLIAIIVTKGVNTKMKIY